MTDIYGITARTESGNRDFDSRGRMITSSKGARGRMQVMPGTSRDPGYGVRPARDDSPEELARVGRDYLDALRRKYGSMDKAWAAYNAGPGRLDQALAGGGNWLARMPGETRAYVAKNMAQLGGTPREYSGDDFWFGEPKEQEPQALDGEDFWFGEPKTRQSSGASGVDVVRALFPKARITSGYRGPDHPLSKKNPDSWHARSQGAVDLKPIPGMTFEQARQRLIESGHNVIEALNEVGRGRSKHATGDHWHFVIGPGRPSHLAERRQPLEGPAFWGL